MLRQQKDFYTFARLLLLLLGTKTFQEGEGWCGSLHTYDAHHRKRAQKGPFDWDVLKWGGVKMTLRCQLCDPKGIKRMCHVRNVSPTSRRRRPFIFVRFFLLFSCCSVYWLTATHFVQGFGFYFRQPVRGRVGDDCNLYDVLLCINLFGQNGLRQRWKESMAVCECVILANCTWVWMSDERRPVLDRQKIIWYYNDAILLSFLHF